MPEISEITCKPTEMKTVADISKVERRIETPTQLDKITNKSQCSLKSYNMKPGTYPHGKNFSFCDLEGADLCGCIFVRDNFSFAVNLDKAITDSKTKFIECNMSFCPTLPAAELMEKCNLGPRPITDEMVNKWAKPDEVK